MFNYFAKEKSDFLNKKDKSKKCHIDKDIIKIVNEINSKRDYYTTSSCSGRIVLLEKLSKKKNESRWLFVKHNKIKSNEILKILKNKIKNEIWFKQEPLILHVRCRNSDDAIKLLNISRKIFKRAGIISLSIRKIVVEIIGNERIDTIVADKDFVGDEKYLKQLIKYANSNFMENKRKSEGFFDIIKNL